MVGINSLKQGEKEMLYFIRWIDENGILVERMFRLWHELDRFMEYLNSQGLEIDRIWEEEE